MIQAMVWALVFTSRAGMSRSGPMMGLSSVVKRQVSPSTSFSRAASGSTMTPPLPPPYGMSTTAHFQVIHIASGADLVQGHVLVIANAALGRSAAEVVLHAVAGEDLHDRHPW